MSRYATNGPIHLCVYGNEACVVHQIHTRGQRVLYPIPVARALPPVFFDAIPDPAIPIPDSPVIWVYIGPAAPLPVRVKIAPPRQMMRKITPMVAEHPPSLERLTEYLLQDHPEIECAWLYEVVMPEPGNYFAHVFWKVWFRG